MLLKDNWYRSNSMENSELDKGTYNLSLVTSTGSFTYLNLVKTSSATHATNNASGESA